MKKKGFKVVRQKHNVYRRKSKGRKVLGAALFVLLLGGLCFAGYLAAPTVIEFISGRIETSSEQSSLQSDISSDASKPESSVPETTLPLTSDTSSAPEPVQTSDIKVTVTAPTEATASLTALEAYLEQAKKQGCTTLLFEMKDEKGQLLYKSDIAEAKDNPMLIKGKLTASQIAKACKKSGITTYATISTLYDSLTPKNIFGTGYYLTGTNYWHWLDAKSEDGGKPWVSPSRAEAIKYLTDITAELCKAGFDTVLLTGMKYPKFTDYDRTIIDPAYSAADRSTKLAQLAAACAKTAKENGKNCYVCIDAAELMCTAAADYNGTAEILEAKVRLGDCGIMVNMSEATVGAQLITSQDKTTAISTDPAKAVKQVFAAVKKRLGDDIIVGFEKGKVTDETAKKMSDELGKLGFEQAVIS